MKKKRQNGKRSQKGKPEESKPVENNIRADANQEPVDETMIKHIQTTLSMLEERKVLRSEVLQLIKKLRQQGIDIEKELGYPGPEPKNKSG